MGSMVALTKSEGDGNHEGRRKRQVVETFIGNPRTSAGIDKKL